MTLESEKVAKSPTAKSTAAKSPGNTTVTTDPLEATLRRCLAAELEKNRVLEEKVLMLELEMAELRKAKGEAKGGTRAKGGTKARGAPTNPTSPQSYRLKEKTPR